MYRRPFAAVLLLTASLFTGLPPAWCAEPDPKMPHEMMNSVLWASTSAERYAVSVQAYRNAFAQLEVAIRDPLWTAATEQNHLDVAALPTAIMLDLDETVLDNTPFEARIINTLGQYSEDEFRTWVEQSSCDSIPGAAEFLRYTAGRGVRIFYFSGRLAAYREATAKNLRRLGLPLADQVDNILLSDIGSTKQKRERVAKTHRILLLIGDNLDDFTDLSKNDPARRKVGAIAARRWWGERWIVLANPMYGHWEASMYEFKYELPREEQLRLKRSYLPP